MTSHDVDSWRGDVAVVTGGGSGIGRALALAWAERALRVVVADIDAAAADAVRDELLAAGHGAVSVEVDVTDPEQVEELANAAFAEGRVRVLCANAGTVGGGLAWEMDTAEFRRVIDVNLFGVVHCVRVFVPQLLAAGHDARVVITASMASFTALPVATPYHASKHAVLAYAEGVHHELELEDAPIGVTVLCPGFVRTRLGETASKVARLDGAAEVAFETLAANLEDGLPPEDVADVAVRAALRGEFYAFAPGGWWPAVTQRLSEIADQRNPELTIPE